MIKPEDTRIEELGSPKHVSPLELSTVYGDSIGNFTPLEARIRYDIDLGTGAAEDCEEVFFEKAGAREKIFYNPADVSAGIVTCGGLCPGLNNVIRSLVNQLAAYGVKRILGIRDGYKGLNPAMNRPPIELTRDMVDHIHFAGGTMLGSSRGPQDAAVIVDFLVENGIDMIFCIGGDGTQRGCHNIAAECSRRGLPIAAVGIPKTIDNDIFCIARSFGYATALEEVRRVLDCAHTEAKCAVNGIGVVKVMGRESGHIAAGATVASQEVNFALIPEVPFKMEGSGGVLELLRKRMEKRNHAVVIVAEGAGQDLMEGHSDGVDSSGNKRLKDIGVFVTDSIKDFFGREEIEVNVKYFDPSYIIRSVPANCTDALLCDSLARNAVHAAMAGKTDCLVGMLHDQYIHVPLPLATRERKLIDPEDDLWVRVHESTGQPLKFQV